MATITAYHGTPYAFEHFKVPASGLHFGDYEQAVHACTLKMARLPLKQFAALEPDEDGWRGRVLAVRLHLNNVKRVEDARTPSNWSRVIKRAKEEGFDGLVYLNVYEGGKSSDSFVVFNAEQVEKIPAEELIAERLKARIEQTRAPSVTTGPRMHK